MNESKPSGGFPCVYRLFEGRARPERNWDQDMMSWRYPLPHLEHDW